MTSRFPTLAEMAVWPKPNYIDPETKQPLALGINVVMSSVIVAFVSCRFYSRTRLVKALGLDDWIMLSAAVSFPLSLLSFLFCVCFIFAVNNFSCQELTRYPVWSNRKQCNDCYLDGQEVQDGISYVSVKPLWRKQYATYLYGCRGYPIDALDGHHEICTSKSTLKCAKVYVD